MSRALQYLVAPLLLAFGAATAPARDIDPPPTDCVALRSLLAPGIVAGENFGGAIAIDGNLIVVGASFDDGRGSALVFRRIDGLFVYEATLIGSGTDAGDTFGASVDVHGDLITVGAPKDERPGSGSGAVYLFRYTNGSWVEEAKLQGPPTLSLLNLGTAVAGVGDTVVAGCEGISPQGSPLSQIQVFERIDGSWTHAAMLPANLENGGFNGYGERLAFDGTTVVSGQYFASNGLVTGAGFGVATRRGPNGWTVEQRLSPPDPDFVQRFGSAAAVDGERLVIGAEADDTAGFNAGSLFTYRLVDGLWEFEQQLTPPDTINGNFFGRIVSMDYPFIAAGSPLFTIPGGTGRVVVYRHSPLGWIFEPSTLPPAGSVMAFGQAVEISDGVVAVGQASAAGVRGVSARDLDRNNVNDACQIAENPAIDCDLDGLIDSREFTVPFATDQGPFAPIAAGITHSFTVASTPRAIGNVRFAVDGFSLTGGDKAVTVRVNGTSVGNALGSYVVFNCSDVQGVLTVSASTFNALIEDGGPNTFSLTGTPTLPACPNSWVSVRLAYNGYTLQDLDFNGTLDVCTSCVGDVNLDGAVDGADLTFILAGWGTDSPDLTADGVVDAADLAIVCGGWGPCD